MDTELTPEMLESMKARDSRIMAVDKMICIESELRNSVVVRAIMDQAEAERMAAIKEFGALNPVDTGGIMILQAKVYKAQFIAETVGGILRLGQYAEQSLRETGVEGEHG